MGDNRHQAMLELSFQLAPASALGLVSQDTSQISHCERPREINKQHIHEPPRCAAWAESGACAKVYQRRKNHHKPHLQSNTYGRANTSTLMRGVIDLISHNNCFT